MQRVWVCDAPFVSLLLQEVKEIFDSQRGAVRRDAEDGLKEVIQELLKSSLRRRRRGKKAAHTYRGMLSWDAGISRWLLRLIWAIKTRNTDRALEIKPQLKSPPRDDKVWRVPWWTAGASGRFQAGPSCGGSACATSWSPLTHREAGPGEAGGQRSTV